MVEEPMTVWTQGRTGALRALWAEGKTTGQITRLLNIRTRNAVIGKLNRLGLIGTRRRDKATWNRGATYRKPAAPRSFTWIGADQ